MSSFFHNSLVFPDHCLMGFGHPTTSALKPSSGAIAAMLFNGVSAFPSPQLPPIYAGYAASSPNGTSSSIATASSYPASAQELIDMIPRSSRLQSPVELGSVAIPAGMTCDLSSSGAFNAAGGSGGPSAMAIPIWRRSDFHHHRQIEAHQAATAFGLAISQYDLDMALYGYTNAAQQQNFNANGYALSGLKSSDLSYGIDRLLGNCEPSSSKQQTADDRVDIKTFNLPEGLGLYKTEIAGFPHYGVVCLVSAIPRSTRFGPFRGRLVDPAEVKGRGDNSFLWEIFRHGVLSHFIDGSDCYWMTYVNCARTSNEQNLVVVQQDGNIYYETCKDVHQGAELLVWYGDAYLKFMGIPIAMKPAVDEHDEFNSLENANDGYTCQRCGKVFAYKYYRDKHLKYTRCVDQGDRKFPCDICSRSFEKRDRLRIHILHVHEKHRPHKCSLCSKCFSQSSSLNKHMRVHSGERPYKCPHCIKAFTASSILRTHIRQHSGEKPFKCKHCGKAFASHAAHDSHVKRTHNGDNTCALCGRFFPDACLLRLHTCARSGMVDRMPRRGDVIGLQQVASFQPAPCTRTGAAFSPTASSSPRPSHPRSLTPASASKCSREDIVKIEDEIDVVGYDFLNEQA